MRSKWSGTIRTVRWLQPASRFWCLAVSATAIGMAPVMSEAAEEEIAFDSADGIRIAGALSTPEGGESPIPAVLLITGNGPHTRDQLISGSPMFKQLADHLVSQGLAVLRTDLRGYGGSTGIEDWEQTTTHDRLIDQRAALSFLRTRNDIDGDCISVLGHSEGAMIAAMLASEDSALASVILIAPSARRGDKVFARQRAENLRSRGASEETAAAVETQLLRVARFLADGRTREEEPQAFRDLAVDFLKAHGVEDSEVDPVFAESLIEGFLYAPWYRWFVAYDPAEHLSRLRVPVLAILAGEDANVPWRLHVVPLLESLVQSGVQDLEVAILPDQDHFFLEHDGRRMEEHVFGEMQVAGELLERIDQELHHRCSSRGR